MYRRNGAGCTACYWLFLLVVLAGCATAPDNRQTAMPLLNSERIQQKFGSYGIDVLESDSALRVSNLYSLDDDRKTTRTFAVVKYPDEVDDAFAEEHLTILNGGSIGAVFKRNGWQVIKQHEYFGTINAAADYAGIYRLMGDIQPVDLAVHIYRLDIRKDNMTFQYAEIAEVHHPDYLQVVDLQGIYPGIYDELMVQTRSVERFLNTVVSKMSQQFF